MENRLGVPCIFAKISGTWKRGLPGQDRGLGLKCSQTEDSDGDIIIR